MSMFYNLPKSKTTTITMYLHDIIYNFAVAERKGDRRIPKLRPVVEFRTFLQRVSDLFP